MVKFIVPETYEAQDGHDKDGKPNMVRLPYDNAGTVVEVPDSDADHFDKKGWKRAEKKDK